MSARDDLPPGAEHPINYRKAFGGSAPQKPAPDAVRESTRPDGGAAAHETDAEQDIRMAEEESRANLRLIDFIADKIGLPHDEELSQENFAAWLRSSPSDDVRSALDREEKYLLEHFDAECGIMPGDVEGSFHRLRAALRSAPVSAPSLLIESFARLQRRLMSYCNHANAGHMPSDAREFARRIQLGFLAAYEEAGVTPPAIEPETNAEYMALLSAPAVGVTRETITLLAERHLGIWVKETAPHLKIVPTAARQDIRDFVDELMALLRSPAPVATVSEPVAWQYRGKYDLGSPRQDEWCDWHPTTEKHYDYLCSEVERRNGRLEVRVLYTSPQHVGREAAVSIEECEKICDRWIASKNLHEHLAATDIKSAIRSLTGAKP